MLHKIRSLVAKENYRTYFESGTTEINDAYLGGKAANKHAHEQKEMRDTEGHAITGRSGVK